MQRSRKDIIKKDMRIILTGIVIMSIFIFFTNPFSMPIWAILLIPVLTSTVCAFIVRLILNISFQEINERTKMVLSVSSAIFVLVLFMLGSLKQLGIQDFALVLTFVTGAAFYFYKSNNNLTTTD